MKNKKKNSGRTALIVLLALVLIIGIAAFSTYTGIKNYDKPLDASSDAVVDFVVPQGASTTKIAKLLMDAGLIKSDQVFKLKSKLNKLDGKFQAGEYELKPSMGMNEIMAKLQDAKRETRKITIKEGWKLMDIADYLEKEGVCTKADFIKSLENDEFDQWFVPQLEEKYPDPTGTFSAKANKFEGFLFPSTYEIYVDASPRFVINKMLNQFAKIFTEDLQKQLKDSGYSLQEIITVASLIEGETVLDSERPLVASVIYNRLNGNATGKKLQIDRTVLYALGYHKDRVLYKDLEIDSPYNTYKYAGLPAGPINSPGEACIKAALNPAETKYLYYVVSSKGDGSHKFTSSYSQHVNNSNEYKDSIK
ncbi:MAG: endolytic transglycosylase MltG [Clostridia bacterium]|nr:endolytic transglycosylase MltG [Clostridia bacterium]